MSNPDCSRLYKYLPLKYARDLVERGSLRLGTLLDFRKEEAYGNRIGDGSEGLARIYDDPKLVLSELLHLASPLVQKVVNDSFGTEIKGVVFKDCEFILEEQSGDLWIYATSMRLGADLLPEFDADACVRIDNPIKFIDAIGRHLGEQGLVHEWDLIGCIYLNKRHCSDNRQWSPEQFKRERYAHQGEARMIFHPVYETVLRPLVISVPEVRRYCTLLDRVPA